MRRVPSGLNAPQSKQRVIGGFHCVHAAFAPVGLSRSVVTVLQTCKSSDPLPSQQPSVAGPAPKHILAALSALCGFRKEQRQLRGENGSRDMGNVREEGVGWI